MSEDAPSIENLSPQDYSVEPREHIQYRGQVAGIRQFDPMMEIRLNISK